MKRSVDSRWYAAPFALMALAASAQAAPPTVPVPVRVAVPVILDTDIGPDIDDAGAVAVLHALADRGEATILAEMLSSTSRTGAAALSAINTYYGRPAIPIGVFKSAASFFDATGPYEKMVATAPHTSASTATDNGAQPDAVALYRRVLAAQPDRSVVVVTVGFLNNLMNLLQSPPDAASPLGGRQLVARKVAKLVAMGGRYPTSSMQPKPEFNFGYPWPKGGPEMRTLAARSSAYVVAHWPTPILFSGVEIGSALKTGGTLSTRTPATNPVRMVYEAFGGPGKTRESWDLTAVLAAVRGSAPYWDEHTTGRNVVDADGHNHWDERRDSDHAYLLPRASGPELVRLLDELLVQPPVARRAAASGRAPQGPRR